MALYLISYDIKQGHESEYEDLWATLRKMRATKILLSQWLLVDEPHKASDIYDIINPLTLQGDGVLVQEVTNDAAWDALKIGDDAFRKFLAHARG
jgi:hypothetical protein